MEADPDGNTVIFQLLLLLLFTLMNAFFAGAEMAVVSVNRNRIRSLAEDGNKKARVIQGLFEDSTRFLSAIQVAITFAGFYSSASAASGIAPVLAGWMKELQIPYSSAIAHNGVTLLLMFFNLVFGELVPKRIAFQKSEAFCMLTVMPVHYISIILSPFIKLLSVSTKGVLRLLRMKTEDEEDAVTEEEILSMMKMGYERGTFDDSERRMVHSIFAFDDRSGTEIMVPRQRVTVLDIEEPLEEIIEEVLESRYSRIPVYEEEIDNIIGILHVKDVLLRMVKDDAPFTKEELRGMLQRAYFVPEKKDADELLRDMQKNRVRLALLVDEYGGFSGIVTLKDLVEEIVGDLHEDSEPAEPEILQVSESEFLLDGSLSIGDLNDEFGLKLESEDYDTISGYLLEQLGYIPDEKHNGSVEAFGWQFSAARTEGNRICSVCMKRPASETENRAESVPAEK